MTAATPPVSEEKVLIVGAGALGTALGYHLGLGGVHTTFYVRPPKVETIGPSRQLYCYEDGSIRTFSGYKVVSTTDEIADRRFSFVIVTLDGAATRSSEGTALLRDLADSIRTTDTVVILCGVGLGLREWAVATTGLDDARVLVGSLAYMCHETDVGISIPPDVDPALVAQADYAYGHARDRVGFTLARSSRDATARFAAMLERNGIERCSVVSAGFYAVFTSIFFCFTVASELSDWPDADGFSAHPETIALAVAAMREIAALDRFGKFGRRFVKTLSEPVVLGTLRGMEEGLKPLNLTDFNRYHHGGKMLSQNVGMLRDCLAVADQTDHPAPALRTLIGRFDDLERRRDNAR